MELTESGEDLSSLLKRLQDTREALQRGINNRLENAVAYIDEATPFLTNGHLGRARQARAQLESLIKDRGGECDPDPLSLPVPEEGVKSDD